MLFKKEVKDTGRKNKSKRNDFDDVFKSLKTNHTELFISVINESFGTHYTRADETILLPTEGTHLTEDGQSGIIKKYSDFLLKVGGKTYLIECQSYADGTMAIRLIEYAFFAAKNNAVLENGRLLIDMPSFAIIYVRSSKSTPRQTEITFNFPNGETVNYDCRNILLSDYAKEDIVNRKLYAFIPYYIMRYENDMKSENMEIMAQAEEDIRYFLKEMDIALANGDLPVYDVANLKEYMKIIIRHIADGGRIEERLVETMGGTVIVTEADKLVNKGVRKGRVFVYYNEMNLSITDIAAKLNMSEKEVKNIIDNME